MLKIRNFNMSKESLMAQDQYYQNLSYSLPEIKHLYGDQIHILKDPYLMTLIEKISQEKTSQPMFTEYITKAYRQLFGHLISNSFTRSLISSDTRMKEFNPEGVYQGEIIDQNIKVVTVDLARAGIVPSQILYSELNYLLNSQNIRQDHFYAARITDANGQVTGVDISGSKIGGDIHNRYVIFPDPMGATGGTIAEAISYYKKAVDGTALKFITAHLMITPEYIQKIKSLHPDCEVYTIRLDRGLSTDKALNSIPGEFPNEERGLNDNQYIVPGAGGIGELLNNSFV